MPTLNEIRVVRKTLLGAWILCLVLVQPSVQAQIQAGRAANGSLLISDQTLPNGVKAAPMALDQLMTLPPATQPSSTPTPPEKPPTRSPAPEKLTPKEAATCKGLQKRYNETRKTLENTERDKASGKLLIPDSGLVTMRQNLATLERLLALCQP